MEEKTVCPTLEQVQAILEPAVRAPSGDNCQPWAFDWNDGCLSIRHLPERARHILDSGNLASSLALGCLLEAIEISASRFGLRIDFHLHDLNVELKFVQSDSPRDPLFDALSRRTTDRRPYQKGQLPDEAELKEVLSRQSDERGARIHGLASLPGQAYDFTEWAETLVMRHPRISLDTLRWVRLSQREISQTSDGMPWRGTGVTPLELPILRVLKVIPALARLLPFTGAVIQQKMRVRRQLRTSAGFYCISARSSEPQSIVNAGRLSMALWLRLNQLGYGVQPLTTSSLIPFEVQLGQADRDMHRRFGDRLLRGYGTLREAYAIPEDRHLVWLFRTGISSPLPSSWMTKRILPLQPQERSR